MKGLDFRELPQISRSPPPNNKPPPPPDNKPEHGAIINSVWWGILRVGDIVGGELIIQFFGFGLVCW